MAYDEALAKRIRTIVSRRKNVTEKEMFGGLAFMLDAKMFVGIMKGGDLMVRVGKDGHAKALAKPHARTMDFTGKPMKGYVLVRPAGIPTAAALRAWIGVAETFVATLPGKTPKRKKAGKPKK